MSNTLDNVAKLMALREAATSSNVVSLGSRRTSSPHDFYRYPARFSPQFAAAAIDAFTERGDLVLDPFVGGGTTLVEAVRLGRRAIGADINPLATFVSRVKATCYTDAELDAVRRWTERCIESSRVKALSEVDRYWQAQGYLRHLDSPHTWRLRNVIAGSLRSLDHLETSAARDLGRCCILRTAQWALDMREALPSVAHYREVLERNIGAAADVAAHFRVEATRETAGLPARVKVLDMGLPELAGHSIGSRSTSLVLTSPPYPGVYVLYHRWKVLGRKETAAPYWVVGSLDGRGLSHYTMGARVDPTLDRYFGNLTLAYSALRELVSRGTWLVQLVGFKNSDDLGRFNEAMSDAGFGEHIAPGLGNHSDGRLWREVPWRRWWAKPGQPGSTENRDRWEVVLIHRAS